MFSEIVLYLLLLTISIVVSVSVSLFILAKKNDEDEMAEKHHDVSVEILEVVALNKERVRVQDFQYPSDAIWKGPLVTRGSWMESRGEFWRYSVEEDDGSGFINIKLESWIHNRTHHHLYLEYGLVYRRNINWDGWNVPLNIVATHDLIPVEEMTRVLEVGEGNAFVVSQKAFKAYKDRVMGSDKEEGEVTVDKRLLYHCLVDRDSVGDDFDITQFCGWPASMILDLVANRVPGEKFRVFSPEEAGRFLKAGVLIVDGHHGVRAPWGYYMRSNPNSTPKDNMVPEPELNIEQ